ncbi:MAG: dephospho-CoA kinase [Phycisphaerae bacterium]|nr:dephospho-CoA kinase [Phycisphaerae bacterium]
MIGLVGGIGAGKSTAAGELARLGCAVIDGDTIGHQLLAEPAVRRRLRDRWGEGIFRPDGAVDRARLGGIVFADARELEAMNAILHPLIRRRIAQAIDRAQADPAVAAVVVDAAVLLEAGWDRLCTHLVFIEADEASRVRRATAARGWSEAAWRVREKSQISLDKKRRRCHYSIANSSSVSHLNEQIRGAFQEIIRTAEGS